LRTVGYGPILFREFVVEQPQRARAQDLALTRLRRTLAFAIGFGTHVEPVAGVEVRIAEEELFQRFVAHPRVDLRRGEGGKVGLGRQPGDVVQRRPAGPVCSISHRRPPLAQAARAGDRVRPD
jgi:hypothetical protein